MVRITRTRFICFKARGMSTRSIHHTKFIKSYPQGKGEEFLCSLSTFDAYVVSRIHKSPKPFVFAVKSTDPITLFENKSDYLHVFCCSEEGGRKWMENILLAKVSF